MKVHALSGLLDIQRHEFKQVTSIDALVFSSVIGQKKRLPRFTAVPNNFAL